MPNKREFCEEHGTLVSSPVFCTHNGRRLCNAHGLAAVRQAKNAYLHANQPVQYGDGGEAGGENEGGGEAGSQYEEL